MSTFVCPVRVYDRGSDPGLDQGLEPQGRYVVFLDGQQSLYLALGGPAGVNRWQIGEEAHFDKGARVSLFSLPSADYRALERWCANGCGQPVDDLSGLGATPAAGESGEGPRLRLSALAGAGRSLRSHFTRSSDGAGGAGV